MVYGNKGFNAYKNNSITYASKDQLLLLLVDGAVKFTKIGRKAILDRDIKKAHENILKTQDIYLELMATLDRNSGKWTEQLFSVYEFINFKLVQANLKKNIEIIDEVLPLIEDVRDMWNEAYKKTKK